MGYMYEFPHTSNFDSDLKQIVEMYISVKGLPIQFAELKSFVEDYFKNLDVANEVNAKLDAMRADGTLAAIINEDIFNELSTKAGLNIGVFIGDSYSDKSTGYDKALPEIIGENLKLSAVKNYAIGGAGYVNGINTNQHFAGQLNQAITEMTAAEKESTSYVFILGGQNDSEHPVNNLLTQLATIFVTAKNNFPNARIVALPLWYNRGLNANNTSRFTLMYYYAMANGCITDSKSWAYLISPSFAFMDDGIHPTQATLNVLGGMISSLCQGANPFVPSASGVFTKQAIISANNAMAWFDGVNVHLHYVGSNPASTIPVGTNLGAFHACYAPLKPVIVKCFTGSDELQVVVNTNGIISTMTDLTSTEVWLMDITYPLYDSSISSL